MTRATDNEWLERFENLFSDAEGRDPELLSHLYCPDSRLQGELLELESYISKAKPTRTEQQKAGRLMERIAFLAFNSLVPAHTPQSYRSVGAQIDLLVAGDSGQWQILLRTLGLTEGKHAFLVEAKATATKVDAPTMARLCSLMDEHPRSVGLGVFFTITGLSGEPEHDKAEATLRDGRLHQVLYNAKNRKPIVVFNQEDVRILNQPGALVRLLAQKIRALEQLCTIKVIDVQGRIREEALPKHLAELA